MGFPPLIRPGGLPFPPTPPPGAPIGQPGAPPLPPPGMVPPGMAPPMGMPPPGMGPPMPPPGMPMGMPVGPPPLPPVPPAPGPPIPVVPPNAAPQLGAEMGGPTDILEALFALLPQPARKPNYPPWYDPRDYPQPEEGWALDYIARDQTEYGGLVDRFTRDGERIRMERVGAFSDFDALAEEQWQSPALADEDQKIAAMIGQATPYYELPLIRPGRQDDAELIEDYLYYLHLEAGRQHEAQGYGDYRMDVARTIIRYGRVCAHTCLNLDAGPTESPFVQILLDPASTFPRFEGPRGPRTVTMVYQREVAGLLGCYPLAADKIAETLLTAKSTGGSRYKHRPTDKVTVKEYWDRRWWLLFIEDRFIHRYEHKYGEPPFIYAMAAYGDPSQTSSSVRDWRAANDGQIMSSAQADLATKGLSHFHTRFGSHATREALLGRLLTRLKSWGNDPLLVYQDQVARDRGIPEISGAEGARSQIWREHEEVREFPISPNPAQLGPILQALGEDSGRGVLPPTVYGLTPGSQNSGYMVDQLSDASSDLLAPAVRCAQRFYQLLAEQQLRFLRDWGEKLGEEGRRGYFPVPRRPTPGQQPSDAWDELTPDLLDPDKCGTRVSVELDTRDLKSLGPLANALSIAQKNGWTSRRQAISLLPLPGKRNPERTIMEIDLEQLQDAPEVKLARLLKWVDEEYEGDPVLRNFIHAQLQQAIAKRSGPPGGPGGGGPPPGPPPGGPVQIQGASLPAMGMPPGSMGGRPPSMMPGAGPPGPAGPGIPSVMTGFEP